MTLVRTVRALGVLLFSVGCAQATPADGTRSGVWWQSATPEERLGYLAGYIDCAVWDAGQSSLAHVSWHNLAPKISKYYATRPEKLTRPVSAILKELGPAEPRNPLDKGGEQYPGKHGIFDGEYWRQSLPEHRLGFTEGYTDCWGSEGVKGAQFSKPASRYVVQLSEWFGIQVDDPGVIRADRADAKIADALRQFRD